MTRDQKRFAIGMTKLPRGGTLYDSYEVRILNKLQIDHLKSGSELSLNEWILKQEPKSPLSEESGEPVFKKN